MSICPPAIYAITHAEPTIRRIARPLEWFRLATRPLIWALNSASNSLLRLIGTDPKAEFAEGSSAQELRQLIAESATGGHLDRDEADMLTGVFHPHEQQARQVMTPAPAVVTVNIDDTAETALRRCIQTGHTRLVAVRPEQDDRVAGVVHTNTVARLLLDQSPRSPIGAAVRPPLIVPETKPLDDLLADLRRDRSSLAIVADEYGILAGIVTIEDIVEEIVGEIVDETDPLVGPVRRLPNGDWYIRGETSVGDLPDERSSRPSCRDVRESYRGREEECVRRENGRQGAGSQAWAPHIGQALGRGPAAMPYPQEEQRRSRGVGRVTAGVAISAWILPGCS